MLSGVAAHGEVNQMKHVPSKLLHCLIHPFFTALEQ
jgi:hypothetical protein